jgi:GcrA cell cycle regulator
MAHDAEDRQVRRAARRPLGLRPFDWSEERIALLRRRWAEGLSASTIANELGPEVSRCAVLGKIHRLKLAQPRFKRRHPRKEEAVLKRRPPPAAFGPPCGLLDLTAATCRWPVGEPGEADFAFCGAEPFKRYPYCLAHCLIAYRPDSRESGESEPCEWAPARRDCGLERAA